MNNSAIPKSIEVDEQETKTIWLTFFVDTNSASHCVVTMKQSCNEIMSLKIKITFFNMVSKYGQQILMRSRERKAHTKVPPIAAAHESCSRIFIFACHNNVLECWWMVMCKNLCVWKCTHVHISHVQSTHCTVVHKYTQRAYTQWACTVLRMETMDMYCMYTCSNLTCM